MRGSSPFNQLAALLGGGLFGGTVMNSPHDQLGAQQQAQANNLLGLGAASAPTTQPNNLQTAIERVSRLISQSGDLNVLTQTTHDRINGPRPEKEHAYNEEGAAAGEMHELHRLIGILEGNMRSLQGKLEDLSSTI